MTDLERFRSILAQVEFGTWEFLVRVDEGRRCYLQISEPDGKCNVTGAPLPWRGRKWFLSPHMTKSEVVQTALKAVLTAVEHEARENFKYLGRPIFAPHFNVDRLWALCGEADAEDVRESAA